jgi:DNA-binding MarR family transcriptional regulator
MRETRSSTRPPAAEENLGIVDGLAQLSFLVQHELGQVAAEHGLSIIQLRLLGVLRDRTPGMQELARHLGLDKSSMTGLVDRAERRNLVQRIPAPHDGRGIQVSLTEQGHELARACTAEVNRRIQDLTSVLTQAQRGQLSRMATILVGGHATV